MKGILTMDVSYTNPRCNVSGTIPFGTPVHTEGALWVVTNHSDVAHFMSAWDFAHSYVEVPTDVVQITET